jgi:hypothetical protein
MATDTVEVDGRFGQEYQGKYVFREITWAKRSRILQKYTKYHPATGQIISTDILQIQAETIMASLTGQPESHPLTLAKLLGEEEGIPIQLGETLSKAVNKLNGLSGEEMAFLSEQSEPSTPTPASPSSVLSKSSDGPTPNSPSNQPEK